MSYAKEHHQKVAEAIADLIDLQRSSPNLAGIIDGWVNPESPSPFLTQEPSGPNKTRAKLLIYKDASMALLISDAPLPELIPIDLIGAHIKLELLPE